MKSTSSEHPNNYALGYLTWWGFLIGSLAVGNYLLFLWRGWIWEMWSPAILILVTFFTFFIGGFLGIYTTKKRYPNFYPFRRVFAYFLWITFIATLMLLGHDYWFHAAYPDFDWQYLEQAKIKLSEAKANGILNDNDFKTISKNIEEGIQAIKQNPTTWWSIFIGRFKYSLVFSMISGLVTTILLRDVNN